MRIQLLTWRKLEFSSWVQFAIKMAACPSSSHSWAILYHSCSRNSMDRVHSSKLRRSGLFRNSPHGPPERQMLLRSLPISTRFFSRLKLPMSTYKTQHVHRYRPLSRRLQALIKQRKFSPLNCSLWCFRFLQASQRWSMDTRAQAWSLYSIVSPLLQKYSANVSASKKSLMCSSPSSVANGSNSMTQISDYYPYSSALNRWSMLLVKLLLSLISYQSLKDACVSCRVFWPLCVMIQERVGCKLRLFSCDRVSSSVSSYLRCQKRSHRNLLELKRVYFFRWWLNLQARRIWWQDRLSLAYSEISKGV